MELLQNSAAQGYSSLRHATQAGPADSTFAAFMQGADNFAQTLNTSEMMSKQALTGEIDPHQLVTALTQTQLAVDTAVAVRNKVVEAYQEILRMPV